VEEVVFIGTVDTWARWRGSFESRGIPLHLVEGLEPRPAEDLEERASEALGRGYSSAIFTSKSAVRILISSRAGSELVEALHSTGSLLVSVGEGTAEALRAHGYRSFVPPVERVGEAVKILGSMMRPGARIAILSSDRLETPPEARAYGLEVDHIRVYRLVKKPEAVKAVKELASRGARAFIVASQAASEVLQEALEGTPLIGSEVHAMTARIASPLRGLQARGLAVYIYEAPSFKSFIESVLERLSGSKRERNRFTV